MMLRDNALRLDQRHNLNPFDDGMILANAFNAVPALSTAQQLTRTIDGADHSFFYNPMWNLLGDFCGASRKLLSYSVGIPFSLLEYARSGYHKTGSWFAF
jgi:hypothetical protein